MHLPTIYRLNSIVFCNILTYLKQCIFTGFQVYFQKQTYYIIYERNL